MKLKLRECCTIQPAKPTWKGIQSLSEWDQTSTITHIPTVYFYQPTKDWLAQPETITNTLKQSLSKTLVHFYPLAGRLQLLQGGRLELNCNAMGVQFIEAESQSKLEDFGDFSTLSSMSDFLIPTLDDTLPIHELPLLLVQLTRFTCGGICLCFNISHIIVDGQSALHFKSECARLARGELLHIAPFLDRKVLRAGEIIPSSTLISCLDHSEFTHPSLLLGESDNKENETIMKKKITTNAILKLTKEQVEKLKRLANEDLSENNKPYTRYETLTGYIWRCACKARNHKNEQPTALGISVDARTRFQPPLPKGYFGNATFDVLAKSYAGDLFSKPLSYAASKIREAINKVTNEYLLSTIDYLKSQPDLTRFQDQTMPLYANPNMGVVSWLSLPLYGFDFGWGKEIYTSLVGTHDVDGDSFLIPSTNGDVVVSLYLQVSHMEDFKQHFYRDIM